MARTKVSEKEAKILCTLSGGVCAFPGCGKRLVEPGNAVDDAALLGEMAHIIADSRQGPRGKAALTDAERDKHTNLIFLCGDHHKIIDSQPHTYSVSVLRQMKTDHEARIHRASSPTAEEPKPTHTQEVIHSSLLPVTHLPAAVFSAPCHFRDQEDQVKKRIRYPDGDDQLIRFLLRDGKLFSFHHLDDPQGPFADVIDRQAVDTRRATDLWADPEGERRYVTLLNKALFKFTARLNVRFDPVHRRYFFPTNEPGKARSEGYRPLNANRQNRDVVWQPKRKATGEARNFWWHLAVGMNFQRFTDRQWCLSLRPERHLTSDGVTPLPPKQIGRRVTSKKARMWNDVYLGEVNFWRDYLSRGRPEIILNFGDQSAVIGTQFVAFDVTWPGIPGDEKPFRNQVYDDDLFSWSEHDKALAGDLLDSGEDDDSE